MPFQQAEMNSVGLVSGDVTAVLEQEDTGWPGRASLVRDAVALAPRLCLPMSALTFSRSVLLCSWMTLPWDHGPGIHLHCSPPTPGETNTSQSGEGPLSAKGYVGY